ncbi:MAG TPA: porin family protein [Nitrospira sp.]|nr:porin family protein [Nitrospira sp.]
MRPQQIHIGSSLCALVLFASVALPSPAGADPLDQVNIGLLSIGGRATYYDPKDADGEWYGGAQVRLHPSHYFAIEGSADYRRNDFADTRVHSYPVQVSALIYPLGTTRLAPFILGGGGWYYTTVKGPGNFDDTQNRFGLHVGGGLQFFFNKHFSIDSTYRYIWLEKIQSKDQNIFDKSFNDNGHMVTIGVNFHF